MRTICLLGLLVCSVAYAESPADSGSNTAVVKPAPKATRISISIDEQQMSLAIPPARPAFVGDDRWSHMLAIVATQPTADGVTLHVATFPKSDDRKTVTNEHVIKQAKVKQRVTQEQGLTIEPGGSIPRRLFGQSPPKKVVVRWVTK